MRRLPTRRSIGCMGAAPAGLTLTEVLMSILVTGIGVLSVISLLPLSFIRSLQATNLTNGTILRYNVESLIDVNKLGLAYVFPNWQPSHTYIVGDVVLATNGVGGNNRRFVCTTAGISGAAEPAWNTVVGAVTTDGGGALAWSTVDHSHYVIDPLGWNVLGVGLQGALGNTGGVLAGLDITNGNAIERFNAGMLNPFDATSLTALPDSWVEQARGTVTNPTANTVDMPGVDLSGVALPTLPPTVVSRVVLLDASGKTIHTRLVTNIANPTITWSAADPLPAGFTPTDIRVETQERRYTWVLTVRRSSQGIPTIDVTVFFRRPLTQEDEQFYSCSGSGTQFRVDYAPLPKPFLKKGGFIFDVTFGRWYRVTDITNDTGAQVTVTVDRPRPQAEALLSPSFRAAFMRGVVDVFPIGTKT